MGLDPEGEHLRILVYGAGAVGGYLGGLLTLAAGHPSHLLADGERTFAPTVTLLARSRVAAAIESHGLRIQEQSGMRTCQPGLATSSAELGIFDLVILAVRTYDVQAAIPDLATLIGEHGLLLAFQNGVGTEEVLADALGLDRVAVGALTVSVVMEEPGVITRTSRGGGIALAMMDGSTAPIWLIQACAASGLPTIAIDDYRSLRWSKLLLNMLGAATSAILDCDLSEIVQNSALFAIEQRAFREAVQVMDRQGIAIVDLPGYSVRLARRIMSLPRPIAQQLIGPRLVKARSGRSPGTRADMKRGKTELGWYSGAVVTAAENAGSEAPVNQALAELAGELAQHPTKRDLFRFKPRELIEHAQNHAPLR